jgi:hypothetical protein
MTEKYHHPGTIAALPATYISGSYSAAAAASWPNSRY